MYHFLKKKKWNGFVTMALPKQEKNKFCDKLIVAMPLPKQGNKKKFPIVAMALPKMGEKMWFRNLGRVKKKIVTFTINRLVIISSNLNLTLRVFF